MTVSDQDVQKQIELMVALIDQEANEKVEEIEVKMDEEFNKKKNEIVSREILLIKEQYTKKEQQVKLQETVQISNMYNQIRFKLLEAQHEQLELVLSEIKHRLAEVTNDSEKYPIILEKLIIQAVYRLLEPEVTVRIRQEDISLVQTIIPNVIKACEKEVGKVKIQIDSHFLPDNVSGGAKLWSKQGKIKVNNTLESRLKLVWSQLLPEICNILFRCNFTGICNCTFCTSCF